MISFMRTASIAPGKTAEALAFAHQITKFLDQKYTMKIAICLPVGGNPHRLGWHTMYASLADLETTMTKIMADPEYLAMIAAAAPNLLPGSTFDDIWRVL